MKKIIFTLMLSTSILSSAYAVCSIQEGFCNPNSSLSRPTLQNELLPDKLNELKKPDYAQSKVNPPFDQMLINTETGNQLNSLTPQYNASCQFGTCLPGETVDTPSAQD